MDSQAEAFLSSLFEGLDGYLYLAFKKDTYWEQIFFSWPENKASALEHIEERQGSWDVYVSPSLYSRQEATKEAFKVTQHVWVDLDGIDPDGSDFPSPGIRIESGSPRSSHRYWKLSSPVSDSKRLEEYNRQLCKAFGGDPSGVNCNKVLRMPGTSNFKYNPPRSVSISESGDTVLDEFIFASLPEVEEYSSKFTGRVIPVLDICKKYRFQNGFWNFFQEEKEDGERHKALSSVAMTAVSLGMNDDEVMSMLIDADDRWRKFTGRPDRLIRLEGILSYARSNCDAPSVGTADSNNQSRMESSRMGPKPLSFLRKVAQQEVNWCIPNLLISGSMGVVFASPGTGKTQFSLQLGLRLSLGQDFLIWSGTQPKRVLFLSLEMNEWELSPYVDSMLDSYSEAQQEKISENFFYEIATELKLGTENGQALLTSWVDRCSPDIIIIDSLSTAVGGELTPTDWDPVSQYINTLRAEKKVTVWWIHHNVKSNFNNKKPTKQDDMYGSRFIARDMSSIIAMWKITENEIEILRCKGRTSKPWNTFLVRRDTRDLSFSVSSTGFN